MPQVDLSALTGQELRTRLDASRARGDATLAYEILREMAARREAQAKKPPLIWRRRAEPHLVTIELDDPMEKDELPPLPAWRPAAAAPASGGEPDPSGPRTARRRTRPSPATPPLDLVDANPPPRPAETPEPLPQVADPQPSPDEAPDTQHWDLRLRREELASLRPRPRYRLRIAASFAAGATAGLTVGWWAAGMADDSRSPAAAPLQVASQVQSRPAPAMLDVSLAEPALDAPAEPLAGPPPSDPLGAIPPPDAAELDPPVEDPPAEPSPIPAEADRTAATAEAPPDTAADGCAAEPTPADREICGDPSLQQLQQRLRRAYADALEAHEDRALLRQRQLAWRETRNSVSDPARLARLYEQRIQKLHAAAAQARAQR